jgi:hypothetical protein
MTGCPLEFRLHQQPLPFGEDGGEPVKGGESPSLHKRSAEGWGDP